MPVEIKILTPEDFDLLTSTAGDVFDDPIQPAAARSFLEDKRHHLAAAIDAGQIIGFASGVHYLHPDKPAPEFWINEVGVALPYRRQGIGKALLDRLLRHAASLGCQEAWVLTEPGNIPAQRLYAAIPASSPMQETVMFNLALTDLVGA